MEATWLTALVSVPLFFVRWGDSIQDAKSYLLRSLAVVALAAWSIRALNRFAMLPNSRDHFKLGQILRTPLAIPILLLVLFTIVSTLLSLSPWVSFWGTAVRRTGTYTFLSCVVLSAVMASAIRTPQQVRRLVTVIILTSLPVSIYAIQQRYHVGPIISTETGAFRVGSTFGNPVFLAAYLIMVVPLAISRVVLFLQPTQNNSPRNRSDLVQSAIYSLIILLQLWAVYFTISRGPTAGLLIGLMIMFLLLAIYWRQTWIVLCTLGIGVLVVGSLLLLAWPNGPFRALANRPEIQRFTSILDEKQGTSGRHSIWAMAVKAAQFPPVTVSADGTKDSLSTIRPLVGYGPDTMGFVSRAFAFRAYNIEMQSHPSCDRIHNDFWDILTSTGWLGLSAYLTVTFLIAFYACQWLSLIPDRTHKALFWSLLLGGSLLGCIAFAGWKNAGYLGLGLRIGSVAGLMAYLVWFSWRNKSEPLSPRLPLDQALLIIALLAGLLAHLIEINFSFGVETTLFYFWVYVALFVVVGHRLPLLEKLSVPSEATENRTEIGAMNSMPPIQSAAAKRPTPIRTAAIRPGTGILGRSWWQFAPEAAGSLALALVMANLCLIVMQKNGLTSASQTIHYALTRLPADYSKPTATLLFALGLSWLVFAATTAQEATMGQRNKSFLRSFFQISIAGIGTGATFGFLVAHWRARMISSTDVDQWNVNIFIGEHAFLVHFFYVAIILMIVVAGYFLGGPSPGSKPREGASPFLLRFVSAVLAVSAAVVVWHANVRWSRVEAMDHWAEVFQGRGKWPVAAAICEASIKATPAAEHQYFFLGKILTEQGVATQDPSQRTALFKKAEQILEIGSRIRPIDHSFLSRRGFLYFKWADTEPDPNAKAALAHKALELHRRAIVLDPGNHELWYTMGYISMAILQSPDQAFPALTKSIELYPDSHTTYGLLGDACFYKGISLGTDQRVTFIRSAQTNYLAATQLALKTDLPAAYRYTVALSKTHKELGEPALAITALQRALTNAPHGDIWAHEESLARLYIQLNDIPNARSRLQRALDLAPPGKSDALKSLQDTLPSVP